MPTTQAERVFSVHGVDEAPSRGRQVTAAGFEAAAMAFLEAHHVEADPETGWEVALMVEDCESGERQCFRIDLGTGETAPCDEAA
jgi:hypothetical protein